MALESLINIFGRDEYQLFDVSVCVLPLSPETDMVKFKKRFVSRISYYYTENNSDHGNPGREGVF